MEGRKKTSSFLNLQNQCKAGFLSPTNAGWSRRSAEPCCLKSRRGPWESLGSYSVTPLPTPPGEGGWSSHGRLIELIAAASVNPVMSQFQRNTLKLPSQKVMDSRVRMYFCKSDANLEIINRQFFLPLYSLLV